MLELLETATCRVQRLRQEHLLRTAVCLWWAPKVASAGSVHTECLSAKRLPVVLGRHQPEPPAGIEQLHFAASSASFAVSSHLLPSQENSSSAIEIQNQRKVLDPSQMLRINLLDLKVVRKGPPVKLPDKTSPAAAQELLASAQILPAGHEPEESSLQEGFPSI